MPEYIYYYDGTFYSSLAHARNGFANRDYHKRYSFTDNKTRAGKDGVIYRIDISNKEIVDEVKNGERYPWHNKTELQIVDEQIARLTAKREKLMQSNVVFYPGRPVTLPGPPNPPRPDHHRPVG